MNTRSPHRSRAAASRFQAGFSLVEVAMSIGIIAFAMIPLVALLPIGLNLHRESVDTSVTAQIIQRVGFDIQQTDFEELEKTASGTDLGPYYFDDQGTQVEASDATRLYDVRAVLRKQPAIPSSGGGLATASLVRVELHVAANPGRRSHGDLFTDNPDAKTYFILVAKND